ncbi:lactate/malate family dehydrogenase [Motilibacter deserti]|uniref:Lactate dehydrogenase n=1 Tax=Motilibacter deserti TaxID=2714956 RepID=A0ABX0H084_9ACTN|nr:lactate dehydrogenase [Motilibacter deserti]
MDVAIVGATGDIGRQLCTQLVERQVVPSTSRLQLVGREDGPSARAAHGLRTDLVDAYDEVAPLIDVALHPDELVADVVVVAAGRTLVPRRSADRNELAAHNVEVFRAYADALARNGSGHEVVIVVSNPVELGVAVFAERLGRHRVIGMGAWLDTLRFRREIALSLGVRRQQVTGFVTGQHGTEIVPLWSTVRVHGMDADELATRLAQLRGPRTMATFPAELQDVKGRLLATAETDTHAAFRLIDGCPPDVRAAMRPWLTQMSGAKTATATASATVDLVDTVLDGRDIVVAGQVRLDGEHKLSTVVGVPVVLTPSGWTKVILDELAEDEEARLTEAAERIDEGLRPWTSA